MRKRNKKVKFLTSKDCDILYWRKICEYESMTRAISSLVKVNQITPESLIADDVFQFSPDHLYIN